MSVLNKFTEHLSLYIEQNLKDPVDIVLKNGNLIVRSFYITRYAKEEGVLEGLTRLEQYSSLREKREPVLCKLSVNEIKEIAFPFDLHLV